MMHGIDLVIQGCDLPLALVGACTVFKPYSPMRGRHGRRCIFHKASSPPALMGTPKDQSRGLDMSLEYIRYYDI